MESILALPPLARVLLLLACLVALLDVVFYLFVVIASCQRKRVKQGGTLPRAPIAVLLRSGYRRQGLEEDVARFLTQEYPDYSVVVVDESGEGDGTPMLDELRRQHPNLYVTATSNDTKFTNVEKLSLTVGIKSTQTEWIVQADRHCPPKSVHWLEELSKHFTPGVNVVVGYSRLAPRQGAASRYAVAQHRWQSLVRLAYARSFGPYLGDARNLAYRKASFEAARGFAGYSYLQRGEGELITYRLAQTGRVRASVDIKAQTQGAVSLTWRDYFRLRLGDREAMFAFPRCVRYKMRRNAYLRLATWLFGCLLLPFGGVLLWCGLGLLVLRRLLFLLCGVSGMVRYKEKWNLLWMWLQDVLAPFVWGMECRRYRTFKRQAQWRR